MSEHFNAIDHFRSAMAFQDAVRASTSFMENLRSTTANQEVFSSSISLMKTIDVFRSQRLDLAKAALEIQNFSEVAISVMNQLSANQLNVEDAIQTISSINTSLEVAESMNFEEEIDSKENEFLEYWMYVYGQIIKQNGVVNSTILFQTVRDIIMILSFVISLQGGEELQINILNNSDSNIEIDVNSNEIDVIITEPEKKELEKNKKINSDIILNPGIQS